MSDSRMIRSAEASWSFCAAACCRPTVVHWTRRARAIEEGRHGCHQPVPRTRIRTRPKLGGDDPRRWSRLAPMDGISAPAPLQSAQACDSRQLSW